VGKRHLEQASAKTGVPIAIDWQPFSLNHNTPEQGEDLVEHLMQKYGPEIVERFGKPDNPLNTAGHKVGISFNTDRRIIRTADSHRLVEWCKETAPDKQDALMEAMFASYFEQASDLSKHAQLVQCAQEAGLDERAAAEMLRGEQYREEVASKAAEWCKKGVSGVPFFIIPSATGGRAVSFSGAHPVESLAKALQPHAR